jgi:hypothetical protein
MKIASSVENTKSLDLTMKHLFFLPIERVLLFSLSNYSVLIFVLRILRHSKAFFYIMVRV